MATDYQASLKTPMYGRMAPQYVAVHFSKAAPSPEHGLSLTYGRAPRVNDVSIGRCIPRNYRYILFNNGMHMH